ncbi:MAG: D-alanyl-D-alanine carboxypeptidase/D-alanyl-D-alanine-endopeptidase [Candidatus Omnitrophota bacterium]|jgi:D-alanyl-D-alanine carboxypeptidase/D-alanyl-D-alanine-endopeptidase (penicillin-binding protein 4)|nr:MAG: D-alanyl-D-alanine carboxypeptidase/D-alanyl-D-alanine-endopeptidase [Candidatus Omnitrophota bacterium]
MRSFVLLFVGLMVCVSRVDVADASLQTNLKRVFQEEIPLDSQWSVFVIEKNQSKPLFEYLPDRRLIPASNMKIPSCAAALLRLGATFAYQTELYVAGTQTGTTLHGDLLVVGSGDPSIGGRFNGGDVTVLFRQWASLLKRENILTVHGNIIGVDDFFDNEQYGLNWNPEDYVEWYAAEISALSFNDGCVDLLIRGNTAPGKPGIVQLNPPTKYMTVQSSIRTVREQKQEQGIAIKREPESRELRVSGAIRSGNRSTRSTSVPNPTLYFVTVCNDVLEAEGIQIHGSPRDGDEVNPLPDLDSCRLVHRYSSPPFSQLAEVCLKDSQNLYAEHFLKTLGAVEYGKGSLRTGAAAVKDVLFRHGCDFDEQYIADGSGLSRENRLSARALVRVLQAMDRSSHAQLFYDSLPLAGVDGTLEKRMRGSAAYRRVHAKTGTLSGVRALSGQIRAKSEKTYFFSILANGPRMATKFSKVMDSVCEMIVEEG